MRCGRCNGTMVLDYFVDMESSEELWMSGWRCLLCGEVIDPLILRHRQVASGQIHRLVTTRGALSVAPVPVLTGKHRYG